MLVVGPIQSNCYIVGCEKTREAAVIDPGGDADKILITLAKDKLRCLYIINTHGHFDHSADNKRLKEVTGAQLLIHPADAPMILNQSMGGGMWGLHVDNSPPPDRYLGEGDIITFGDISLKVLHTPGHSSGGIHWSQTRWCLSGILSSRVPLEGPTFLEEIMRACYAR